MAFAPPPGITLRLRCLRISTGASRETREISPKMNSSATRSPSTVTVTLGNASTIFFSRSVSSGCLLISVRRIFSCPMPPFLNPTQHGIHRPSRVGKLHLHRDHRQRLQCRKIPVKIDAVFLGRDETPSLALVF